MLAWHNCAPTYLSRGSVQKASETRVVAVTSRYPCAVGAAWCARSGPCRHPVELLEKLYGLVQAIGHDFKQLAGLSTRDIDKITDDLDVAIRYARTGEPVSAIEFDYEGNERRGLTAKCRRAGGSEHTLAATESLRSLI